MGLGHRGQQGNRVGVTKRLTDRERAGGCPNEQNRGCFGLLEQDLLSRGQLREASHVP